jgi:hypothetical protein
MLLKSRKFKIKQPHLVRSFLLMGISSESQGSTEHHIVKQSLLLKSLLIFLVTISLDESPTLIASFNVNYLPKFLHPNTMVRLNFYPLNISPCGLNFQHRFWWVHSHHSNRYYYIVTKSLVLYLVLKYVSYLYWSVINMSKLYIFEMYNAIHLTSAYIHKSMKKIKIYIISKSSYVPFVNPSSFPSFSFHGNHYLFSVNIPYIF